MAGSVSLPGSLVIGGDLSGTVSVGTVEQHATFQVLGAVTDDLTFSDLSGSVLLDGNIIDSHVTIKVTDMNSGGDLELNGGGPSAWFPGTIVLENGIPDAGSDVFVQWFDGTIDLDGGDVVGDLLLAYVRAGTTAQALDGGAIYGNVLWGYLSLYGITAAGGNASFTGIRSGGVFHTLNVDLTGDITFTGAGSTDVDGDIWIENNGLAESGSITIGGNLGGDVTIDDDPLDCSRGRKAPPRSAWSMVAPGVERGWCASSRVPHGRGSDWERSDCIG